MQASKVNGTTVRRVLRGAGLSPAIVAVLAGSAYGQTAGDDPQIEEILVTAQKRVESIQKVPISITGFSTEDLEQRSIVGLEDLAKATPNLSFLSDGTLKNTAPSIRGVFSPGAAQTGIDTPVATYVDEVYMGTTVGQNFNLYDIERVEVLRGPQGTLFGRNALSGLINVITPVPGEETAAYAEATFGNYDLVRLRAGVSGELVAGLLYGSLSSAFTDRGGYVRNRFTGRAVNDEGNWGVRAKLRFTPSDVVEIIASLDYREVDQSTRTYDIAGFFTTPGPLFQPHGPAEVDTDPFDRSISQDFEGRETLEELGGSLTVNVDLGFASLKSISAFRTHDYFQSYDADNTEIPITIRETPEDFDSWSQELRLTSSQGGRFDWIVGVNYYHQKTTSEFASILNNETLVGDRLLSTLLPPEAIGQTQATLDFLWSIGVLDTPDTLSLLTTFGALTPPFGETRSVGKTKLDSYAAYGSTTFHVTDRLNLTAGIRYIYERKSFAYEQASAPGNEFFLLPTIAPFRAKETFNAVTPAIGIDYRPSDNAMLYAKASRGYKSGGFNDGFASTVGNAFQAEKMWNFEAGAKATFLDGRLRTNLAAYLMRWDDVQTIFNDIPDGSVIPFFTVDTAGDIEIKGLELEATALVTRGLTLTGGLGLINARFASVSARLAAAGGAKGDPVENVPEYSIYGGIEYAHALSGGASITIGANIEARGKVPLTTVRTGFPNEQSAYSLVDGHLSFNGASGHWTVQFWGKNLTNKKYVTALFDVDNTPSSPIGAAYHSLGTPRTYGVTLRSRF